MTLYEIIAEGLRQEPIFKDFLFQKNGSEIKLKFNGGAFTLCMRRQVIDPDGSLKFYVAMRVLYKAPRNWVPKYCVRSPKDRQGDYLVGETLDIYAGKIHKVHNDVSLFAEEYRLFKADLIEFVKYFITNYSSLKKVFDNKIYPYMVGDITWENRVYVEFCIEYLVICRIVSPENYARLKSVVLDEFKFFHNREELNYMRYHDKINDILEFIENTDYKAIMNKKGWTTDDVIPLDQFI